MKTISDYTIYCTEEQIKKALELGAPIMDWPMFKYGDNDIPKYVHKNEFNRECFCYIPTAEQMCNWLRKEKSIFFTPKKVGDNNYVLIGDLKHYSTFDTCEEAILAGIDVALEYLLKNKK